MQKAETIGQRTHACGCIKGLENYGTVLLGFNRQLVPNAVCLPEHLMNILATLGMLEEAVR